MSQENVELYHRSVEAFNRRDWDVFLTLMSEDVYVESRLVADRGVIAAMRDCVDGGTRFLVPFPTTPWWSRKCATSETRRSPMPEVGGTWLVARRRLSIRSGKR